MSHSLFGRMKPLCKCLLTAQHMHKMPKVFQHAVYALLWYCLSENPSYDLTPAWWLGLPTWLISVPCCKRKSETNTKHTHNPLSKYFQKTKRGKVWKNLYKWLQMPSKHRHSGQITYATLLTTAIFGGDELPFGIVCFPPCTKWQAQMTNFGWPIRHEESQH